MEVQRRRAERRRLYEHERNERNASKWISLADEHRVGIPLKSLDEWLGHIGPKLRSSGRELERQPTIDSFLPKLQENHSQYDSEMRANLMAKNSEKLRTVDEQLSAIASKARSGGSVSMEKTTQSLSADEVLGKLTPEDLEAVHKHFDALGGILNLTEFVEVMQAHLPKDDWKDHESLVNNLVELCAQLDINGDGMVSWEEMFEFTVRCDFFFFVCVCVCVCVCG